MDNSAITPEQQENIRLAAMLYDVTNRSKNEIPREKQKEIHETVHRLESELYDSLINKRHIGVTKDELLKEDIISLPPLKNIPAVQNDRQFKDVLPPSRTGTVHTSINNRTIYVRWRLEYDNPNRKGVTVESYSELPEHDGLSAIWRITDKIYVKIDRLEDNSPVSSIVWRQSISRLGMQRKIGTKDLDWSPYERELWDTVTMKRAKHNKKTVNNSRALVNAFTKIMYYLNTQRN